MKSVAVAFVGLSGSGTSTLASRTAAILGWPCASFGSYVRAETARRGLAGGRHDLQNVGLDLLKDVDRFCDSVIAQSRWREGQCLLIDGLRHEQVLATLQRKLQPMEVIRVWIDADPEERKARLLQRGELVRGSLENVDKHPVEKEVLTRLPADVDLSCEGDLSEDNKIDRLVEQLMDLSGVPALVSRITSEWLVRVPLKVRADLGLSQGDLVEFEGDLPFLAAMKILDVHRIRSVFGRLRMRLGGATPAQWVERLRLGNFQEKDHDSSS